MMGCNRVNQGEPGSYAVHCTRPAKTARTVPTQTPGLCAPNPYISIPLHLDLKTFQDDTHQPGYFAASVTSQLVYQAQTGRQVRTGRQLVSCGEVTSFEEKKQKLKQK